MSTIASPGAAMTPKTSLGSNYAWLILVACIGFYAIPVGVVGNTSGIFLTPVMEDMGWDRTTASLYMTIQPWVAAICTPFAAKIMQKYNPRWVLTIAVAAYGLATIWTAYAQAPWEWHAYGVIYGISCSFFMFLAVPVLITAWFKKRAGVALGITSATLSLIAAFFSPIALSMIQTHDWRFARLVLGIIITVVPTILTALFVRKDPLSMGVLAFGEAPADTTIAEDESAEAAPAEPAALPGASMEQAKRTPAFYMLLVVAGFFVLCAAFFQQIPSFAATGALGAAAGAFAVTIIMAASVIGKFLLGWMSDMFGALVTGVFASVCGATGLLLAFLSGSNQILFFIGMGVFGVGYSALTVVSPMLARDGFGVANYADIYKWVSTSIFVFSGAAALIFARIYDMTKKFDAAFILVIVLYVLSAIMIPIIVKTARKSWAKS
jgi:MFS family permease